MLSTSSTAEPALSSLRLTLEQSGYSAAAIERDTRIGARSRFPELRAVAQIAQLEREADDPPATLIALFALGAAVEAARLGELAPDLDLDGLEGLGLIQREGGSVSATVKIDEIDGLYLLADRDATRSDFVMAMSPSTRLTAAYTPRHEADTALDLGTGCGVHALLAARHAGRVVATDINPRALWMTELNLLLNGIGNVETREGSFFEPVAGERFDLAVTNPPYIVSPDTSFLYRDAGRARDSLCRRIAADLPGHLTDDGFGVLQCNWIHARDDRWPAPIAASLAGSGCDAWLMRVFTESALEYAARWAEPQNQCDPAGYEEEMRRWLGYYDDEGIEAITLAMVLLRRRPGASNWRRAVTVPGVPDELLGHAVARRFVAEDRLAALDDDALLDLHVRAPEGLVVLRRREAGSSERCALELEAAMGMHRPVDPEVADAVERLTVNGRPLRESLPAGGSPPLRELRALLKLGFLEF